jgi:hypothetical protein
LSCCFLTLIGFTFQDNYYEERKKNHLLNLLILEITTYKIKVIILIQHTIWSFCSLLLNAIANWFSMHKTIQQRDFQFCQHFVELYLNIGHVVSKLKDSTILLHSNHISIKMKTQVFFTSAYDLYVKTNHCK